MKRRRGPTDGPWRFRRNWLRRNDRDLASLAWRLANDRKMAGLGSTTVLRQLGANDAELMFLPR